MKYSSQVVEPTMRQALKNTFSPKRAITLVVLGIAVFASAIVVVYVKNTYRLRYIHLQELHQETDQLETQWSQIILEKGTWAAQMHVESVATQQLDMVTPSVRDIRDIVLPNDVQVGS